MKDYKEILLEEAKQILIKNKNYNTDNRNVACAILTASGKIYHGLNVDWWNSTCAECVALGSAFLNGDRDLVAVLSLKQDGDDFRVVTPCGICRQMFALHAPEIKIIFMENNALIEKTVFDMLPYAYID